MKKRILFTVFVSSMLLLIAAAPVSAAPEVTVVLDGKTMSFVVPPQIMNDRTMVPLRAIFEDMGASIVWNGDTQTVTATKDSTVVVLTIGSTSPTINGSVVTIDQPGVIVDGRPLAPLRFVAEAFGATVAWNDDTKTASISTSSDERDNADIVKEDELPDQIEITVYREGFPDTYIGTLAISSRFGYTVYILPDFEFLEIDGCDLIATKEDPPDVSIIYMQIYEANVAEPIRDNETENDIFSEYKRVTLEDKVIEIQFNYPTEAVEGGAVLLRAMADSIRAAN